MDPKKFATQEDLDGLKKSVSDLVEAVKGQNETMTDKAKEMIKEVLQNHPGRTHARTMEFPTSISATPEQREKAIIRKMPEEMRREMDDLITLSFCLNRPVNQLKAFSSWKESAKEFTKALDAQTAGGGYEWVPTGYSDEFFEFVRLSGQVVPLFRVVPMPTNPYKLPIGVGRIKTYKYDENTDDTGQTAMTVSDASSLSGAITLTAVGHAARVLFSKDVEEDSIVPLLPYLRQEIIKAMAEGREDCVLNGDTAGSHEDTDISSGDRRTMWLGLRAMANDQSYVVDLSTFNLTGCRNIRSKMGKYGVNPKRLAWITGISGFFRLIGLPECVTVDKLGPNATILNGQMATFDGSPLIVSEFVRENLTTSGIYGATGDRTVLHCVNRDEYLFGERRVVQPQLLKEVYAMYDQDALILRERVCFDEVHPIASNASTYMGRGLKLTA